MKLSSTFILLFGAASAAKFSKCSAIEAHKNENSEGPICEVNACKRNCKDGFKAKKPRKVTCNKTADGKFEWNQELGGCKVDPNAEPSADPPADETADEPADAPKCKDLQLKKSQKESGMTATYKTNPNNDKYVVTVACPAGNELARKGLSTKKLLCKCNKAGEKCKWKNDKKKKVTKAIYQKWTCVSADGTTGDDTTGGDTDKPDPCPKCTDLQKAGLARHNELRALHGSPAMTMSESLNEQAMAYAQHLVDIGQMQHAGNLQELGQGENLAWSWSSAGAQADYSWATQRWYDEIDDPGYDFSNPGWSSGIGHFTQVVWVKSTELGMGHAAGADGSVYIVARYSPAGNFMGQFEENVPNLV